MMKIRLLDRLNILHDLTFLDFGLESSEPNWQRATQALFSHFLEVVANEVRSVTLPSKITALRGQAEGWQYYINCGQWPTTGGPTHAIPLPNLLTKRVPIT